jgi:CRISPR-associated protein Csc2
MILLEKLSAEHLPTEYEPFPKGRFVTLLLIRKTESETIFRTEGSGEGLVKETTVAGRRNSERIRRVVISKRKQTAVERRTGRDLLRQYGFLRTEGDGACIFNTANPCGRCIDCMVYGYAVGTGGAQKSRVLTDDAFSIAPSVAVTDRRTFNALFDNSTMRHPTEGRASTSINEDEYVRPEVHFLDMETLKDVTPAELTYVVGNILRSTRYGAISSRIGRIKNEVVAIVLSDCELFSNLELTQSVFDLLLPDGQQELPFPLADSEVQVAVRQAIGALLPGVATAAPLLIEGEQLEQALAGVRETFADPELVRALLDRITAGYPKS